MKNPWKSLPTKPPYLLKIDKLASESFNQIAHPVHKLQHNYFPEPFMGNVLKANVLLLNLNPCVNERNKEIHKNDPYLLAAKKIFFIRDHLCF